ncbi:hypothetical protein KBZ07_08390 [Cyanobium sp. BA20m-14]|uniref:hypothetical protein n=1 Tax=Cyanobium sp. BA20m-14 TaxID=2823703 RepID=UPI0020CDB7F4|nr:hypothetical protein [Cyanobium sp. BA20m-14]MCP9913423.1 hypothetical protein [Cyanobium sp. BA20m-14]
MEDGLISRAEIVSGGLARQRRARLLQQQLLDIFHGQDAPATGLVMPLMPNCGASEPVQPNPPLWILIAC